MDSAQRCSHCGKHDSGLKRCGMCKSVFYCSRDCQRLQWKTHKLTCLAPQPSAQASGEGRVSGGSLPKAPHDETEPSGNTILTDTLTRKVTTVDQFMANMNETYPPCPLQPMELQFLVAKLKSDSLSPLFFDKPVSGSFRFITDFTDVKGEWEVTVDPEWPWGAVLVAKIIKLDLYRGRHGIVISDEKDRHMVVYFYMPSDNPWPYFKLDQLRPGNYICIRGPFLHSFFDWQVGFRVNTPDTVRILSADGLCLGY